VKNIKKWKAEYLKWSKHESDILCKKGRKTSNSDINKATLSWFHKMTVLNAHISGPLIQEAAVQFGKGFEVHDLQARSEWLDNFKKEI
jgi:hypothetical protein